VRGQSGTELGGMLEVSGVPLIDDLGIVAVALEHVRGNSKGDDCLCGDAVRCQRIVLEMAALTWGEES
jgi:hypothetical protein